MNPVRVVVVDDHPIFQLGLAAAMDDMEGIELVAQVERAAEVDAVVLEVAPDVVLLDLNLPDGSGLDVLRRLGEHHPDVRVLVLTMSEDVEQALVALRDGARGFLVKGAGVERLERAIHSVVAGDVVLDPEQAVAITQLAALRTRSGSGQPFPRLTTREVDVLDLVARGLDNTAIAQRLYLNPKTVRNHVSNVLAKIHAKDRAQAIVLARQAGLGGSGGHPG